MSVVGAGTLSATWTHTVNGWFERHRGLAIGIASTGTGITGFLIKPLTAWLIGTYGWRAAFAVIGLLPIAIGVPMVAMLFRERGEASVPSANPASENVITESGLTTGEAVRTGRFWIMAAAFLAIAYALTAPTPNLENILRTFDFTLPEIGGITAGFGLAVIAGRVGGGWLLDRFWAPACAIVVLALPLAACVLLSRDNIDALTATLAVIGLGLGAGFEFDLLAYLIARYFGRKSYGTLYGCLFTVIALGGGLGPVVFGRAFDLTGHYDVALLSGAAALLTGSVLLLFMGRYPVWEAGLER
jgi:MFS family permease